MDNNNTFKVNCEVIDMRYPLDELLDKKSIIQLKIERIDNGSDRERLKKEIEDYTQAIEKYVEDGICSSEDVERWFEELYKANGIVWDLETNIRKGQISEMSLNEIGRTAIEIRESNGIRVRIKSKIVDAVGIGYRDIKINHASMEVESSVMKVLFITKPFFIEPLGIMHLSSVVKTAGHKTDLITTSEDVELKVKEFKPHFIFYSIMTGDHGLFDEINRKLRKEHKFFSIAGGPHATFFPEMLKNSSFDAVCIGEGERAIEEFLKDTESLNAPNFWFKVSSGIIKNPVKDLIENLDDIPFPDRAIVFKYPEIRDGPIKHFIASRGCPYNCSYCFNESYAGIYKGKGSRVRFRSVDNLLKEVKEVVESSPTMFVYFQDDTFILKPEWIKEFAMKYPSEVGMPFHCHTRANLVTEEIVKDLKTAGCYSVHIAAESGNDDVRREVLNRNMSNEQIFNAVELFKKYDIKVMLQNIIGLPFTTLKNDFETLELNIKCQPDYPWVSIFQPYPKTALGQRCVDEGVYHGDFSDMGSNFFDGSVIDIENKNEIVNLQKLFAIAVKNPDLYYSGVLQKLIELPCEVTRKKFEEIYKSYRKKADEVLYGFEL